MTEGFGIRCGLRLSIRDEGAKSFVRGTLARARPINLISHDDGGIVR